MEGWCFKGKMCGSGGGEAAFASGGARSKALILRSKISESMRLGRIDCGFAAPDAHIFPFAHNTLRRFAQTPELLPPRFADLHKLFIVLHCPFEL